MIFAIIFFLFLIFIPQLSVSSLTETLIYMFHYLYINIQVCLFVYISLKVLYFPYIFINVHIFHASSFVDIFVFQHTLKYTWISLFARTHFFFSWFFCMQTMFRNVFLQNDDIKAPNCIYHRKEGERSVLCWHLPVYSGHLFFVHDSLHFLCHSSAQQSQHLSNLHNK